jgi:cytochrome c biogenesis protein CcmG, thiol:disulfide interchange protein DsbE
VRRALTLALVALLLTGCSSDPSKAQSDRLPDVTLDSLTGGQPVDLGDLRGPVVVNLWAQWCKPCKRELPIYQTFYQQHRDMVSVLGVDWQDVQTDRARKLASKSGVTYPLVVDDEPEIRNKLLPTLILVDKQGKVAYRESVEITSLAQLERLVEKHLGVTL